MIQHDSNDWYSVKSLVWDPQNKYYEERTVLIRAESDDAALDKAIKDIEKYCENLDFEYCGYSETSKILDTPIEEYSEVYSTMRYSDLPASDYIKRFLKTSNEVNLE